MTFYPVVEFRSGFPDDTIEDGDDIVQWPGRNISEVLKAALERLNYRVSEPIHAHEHGWELDVWWGNKRLWLQISVLDADECYLTAENKTFWLWPDAKVFRAFLADLQRTLAADDKFSITGWFPSGGQAPGVAPATSPFDA